VSTGVQFRPLEIRFGLPSGSGEPELPKDVIKADHSASASYVGRIGAISLAVMVSVVAHATDALAESARRLIAPEVFSSGFQTTDGGAAITALLGWGDNWDGRGTQAPDPAAVAEARRWIASFEFQLGLHGREARKPHVSASVDRDVVLEWWHGSRKLTVYVSATSVEYVRVWGPDMEHEMDDGALTMSRAVEWWLWLAGS
jgi:hypothetical protein